MNGQVHNVRINRANALKAPTVQCRELALIHGMEGHYRGNSAHQMVWIKKE
jgi:hypothetical protein